jgi:hypothetical protein
MIQNPRTLKSKELTKTIQEILAFHELHVKIICDSLARYVTSKEKRE